MAVAYQTFRTSAETNAAVRTLTAELSAALGGARVTHDQAIHAAVSVARAHWGELLQAIGLTR